MKTLKFTQELVNLIKAGSKTVTWRLFDDKDLQTNDIVSLIRRPELTPFAEAKILKVTLKPFKEITAEDKFGHESVGSDEDMYKTYSKYYNREVSSDTEVKVIRFEIIRFL